ncbi:MAG: hypothetical protein ACM4AI_24835 [Acidobacteriota bacterium]
MFGRRLRRTAAPLLLLAWIAGLALPVLGARHASLFDDPACERPVRPESGPQVGKDVQPPGDGHCGICHLQRAVRGALHAVVLTPLYVQAIALDRVVAQCDLFSSEHAVASSRAPPSLFLIS